MKRFLVLVNPSSHGGRAKRRLDELQKLLPEGEFVILKDIEEAFRRAREAVGYEAVVACGGDGTISAVTGGLTDNPDVSIKLGVLYTGTSPDFCRDHGLPLAGEEAIRLLREGTSCEFTPLTANSRAFICSLNLGMGAEVARRANILRPLWGDGFGTFFALLRGLCSARRYTVELNGERLFGIAHAMIIRTPSVAGGLRLSLPALRDNEYAFWFVRPSSPFWWIRVLWRMYRGKPCGEFRILRGTAHISSEEPVAVEYDGDPHGELPVTIAFASRTVKLISPTNRKAVN